VRKDLAMNILSSRLLELKMFLRLSSLSSKRMHNSHQFTNLKRRSSHTHILAPIPILLLNSSKLIQDSDSFAKKVLSKDTVIEVALSLGDKWLISS